MGEKLAHGQDAPEPPARGAVPAAEPGPFRPDDVVPRFRADLRVARGSSAAFLDVSDPAAGRTFTLREFELSIARLLDGRRTVAEVIEGGARLGIPIDARSLRQFTRQMARYGFLAAPGEGGEAAREGGTWDAREPWDEETRALFQTGQRLLRLGRNAEAAAYLEAILDGHPAHPEAQALLALVSRGHSLAIGRTLDGAGEAWPAPPARPRSRRHPAVVGAAVVPLALLALAALALLAPRGPERAAPVASTPAAPWPARTLAVERRSHPLLAELVAPAAGELVWTQPADARVATGERLGEVRVAGAETAEEAALARRVRELERLAARDAVHADLVERARRELREAEARRPHRAIPVVAPAAGLLARAPGATARAAAGAHLARILDPAVWDLAAADVVELPADGCEVVGDTAAERAPCRVLRRGGAGRGIEVVAEVAAADAPWVARAGTLWLRLEPGRAP